MKNRHTLWLLLGLCFVIVAKQTQAQVETYLCSHEKLNRWAPTFRTAQGDAYDMHYVIFDLELSNRSNAVGGNVTLHAKALAPLDTFWFELRNHMMIDSLKINGTGTGFIRQADMVKVVLPNSIPVNQTLVCQVFYHGSPPNTGQFFNSVTTSNHFVWQKPTTYTLSQPYGAPDWYPCKQDNSDKIDSVYFMATTDDSLTVASIGVLQQIEPLGNGKRKFHWKTRYPTAMYLVGFSVAKYVEYISWAKPKELTGDSVLIQHMVYDTERPGLGNCLDFHRDELIYTNRLMELMSDSFGLYPFYKEKYGHMHSPMGGGMEHQTMSTMGFFSEGLNAHELIHQWFGDYVTCSTWEHIWLNEGFGSYGEYFNLEHKNLPGAAAWLEDAHNQAVTEPQGSIVTPPNPETSRIFNRALTYKKSAAVIHMLRYQMGDIAFFRGVRQYLSQHAFGTANSTDFKVALEASSGQNLTSFFNEWVFGYGFPGYQIRWNQVDDSLLVEIRSVGTSDQTPTFSIPVPLRTATINGESEYFNLAPGFHKVAVGGLVDVLWFDEQNVLLKGIVNVDKDAGFVATTPKLNRLNALIWPNPSNLQGFNIHVDGPTQVDVVVFSVNGQSIFSQRAVQNRSFVHTNLPEGMYWVEATDALTGAKMRQKWLNIGR